MTAVSLQVTFVMSALQAPLLPTLPTYPPAQLAGQKSHMCFEASLAILSGQLYTVDASPLQLSQLYGCGSGFVVGLHDLSLRLEATASWVGTLSWIPKVHPSSVNTSCTAAYELQVFMMHLSLLLFAGSQCAGRRKWRFKKLVTACAHAAWKR